MNILIGSSNVYRHYKARMFPDMREYKIVKCTQSEVFNATMANLVKENKFVLVSVIENFIADAVGNDTENPDTLIDTCITEFIKTIEQTAVRLPETKIGVVLPISRPALSWYQEGLDQITGMIKKKIGQIVTKSSNVSRIECGLTASQEFETDLVHLTTESAKVFLEIMLGSAEDYFNSDMVDLSEDEDGEIRDQAVHRSPDAENALEARIRKLEDRFKMQDEKERGNDLMFARMREEIDFTANKGKEDRVVINGLKSRSPLPADTRARIDALRKLATEIFNAIIPGFKGKIVYLTQGKNNTDQHIPMVEVKLDSVEAAQDIRKSFAQRRKKNDLPEQMKDVFVANSVNLATRVRIEIMKCIAKKLTNVREVVYVAGFSSRPMMHVRSAGPPTNSRPLRSYNFVDAVTRFGGKLADSELGSAYNRAGVTFNGQLRQNFIVLNELKMRSYDPMFGKKYGTGGSGSGAGTSGGARGGSGRGGGASAKAGEKTYGRGKKRSGEYLPNSSKKH